MVLCRLPSRTVIASRFRGGTIAVRPTSHTTKGSTMSNLPLLDLFDKLTDPPSGGTIQKWIAGIVSSVLLLSLGISCLVTQSATVPHLQRHRTFYGTRTFTTLIEGTPALCYGALLISVALYCHFQWYWGNSPRLSIYYEPLRLIALLLSIAMLFATIISIAFYS